VRRRAILAFSAILWAHPVLADEDVLAQAKICAEIGKDSERLECYDLIFKKTERRAEDGAGDWQVDIETSKLDDSKNVFMSLTSGDQIKGRFGDDANMILHVVCRERKVDFYVTFGENFMSDIEGYGNVTLRLDAETAFKKSMTESTDHGALGIWSPNAISFVKTLLGHDHLLVRATPYNANAITSDFVIKGLENAVKPLRTACKW
jgi:type VI secretion system protein VasI